MDKLVRTGRLFYAIAMGGIGFQLFYYSAFYPVIVPAWPSRVPGLVFWAYLAGAAIILASLAIILEKNTRKIALVMGGILLLLFVLWQIPYELIVDPYSKHLGVWTNALKELALSGGAFVVAGSFPDQAALVRKKGSVIGLFTKLIPYGPLFFCITMISFGIDHLLYTKGVSMLVPAWMPGPIFWTYFAAVALICSGLAIIFKIRLRLTGTLMGVMIFLWFIVLHIPRAIADPSGNMGNEVSSAWTALAFSGIAFIIAGRTSLSAYFPKKD
jgi:uncharacterized membrane protein